MLFILNLAIGAGSGLAVSVPFLGWMESAVHKRMRKSAPDGKSEISGWHTAGVFVFAFFLAGILTLTGVPAFFRFHFDANINIIPMAEFFSNFKQYMENMLLFMPLGFLVPLLWRREQMVEKTVSIGFLFSLFIEIAQLFSFRVTDIDDLLMNTLGTWLGYLVFLAVSRVLPGLCGRFGVGEKPDPGSLWKEEEACGREGNAAAKTGGVREQILQEQSLQEQRTQEQSTQEQSIQEQSAYEESPVCRYEMELTFAIVLLLMMTLQPLLADALWNLWYG